MKTRAPSHNRTHFRLMMMMMMWEKWPLHTQLVYAGPEQATDKMSNRIRERERLVSICRERLGNPLAQCQAA